MIFNIFIDSVSVTAQGNPKGHKLSPIMTLQVFQAVTLNTSAYQPHALLMRILSAEGPSILREYFRPRAHNKSHRQLGLVQIRIALQEVCGQSQIKQ